MLGARLILPIIMMVMLTVNAQAFFLTIYDDYQNDLANTGLVPPVVAGGFAPGETILKSTRAVGGDYQPMIADVNHDLVPELYVEDSGSLRVYEYDDGLALQDEVFISAGRVGTYTFIDDITGDGIDEIVGFHGNLHFLYTYTADKELVKLSEQYDNTNIPRTSKVCKSGICYYGDIDGNVTYHAYAERDLYISDTEPGFDGTYNGATSFTYILNEDDAYDLDHLLTSNSNFTAWKVAFNTSTVTGPIIERGMIYDLYICPTNVTSLSNNKTRGADCSSPRTLVADDLNISQMINIGAADKFTYLPFDMGFDMTSDDNYIIMMDYVSNNAKYNTTSGILVYADTNTANNYFRAVFNDTTVTMVSSITDMIVTGYEYFQNSYDACGAGVDCFNAEAGAQNQPALVDYDNDNDDELFFICDYNDDGGEGILSWDVVNDQEDTLFGHSDNLCGGSGKIGGVVVTDLDGGGYRELAYSCTRSTFPTVKTALRSLKADGSTLYNTDIKDYGLVSVTDLEVTTPVLTEYDGYDRIICAASQYDNPSGKRSNMKCMDFADYHSRFSSRVAFNYDSGAVSNNEFFDTHGQNLLSFNSDYSRAIGVYDIAAPSGIFVFDTSTNNSFEYKVNTTQSTADYDYYIAAADINGDELVDVCEQQSGEIFCSYTDTVNEPPELTGEYGSVPDYESPICVNDTVTFEAKDCGGGSAFCNYDNDFISDAEYLVTDCGYLASDKVGDDDLDNPEISCDFNSTGIFSVRIYLRDNANPADSTQYDDLVVTVIDGEPGVTCSIGSKEPEPGPGPGPSPGPTIDDDVEATIGLLLGTTPTLRLIIGLGLVIATVSMVGVSTGKAALGGLGGFIMLLMVTALGLVSLWITILALAGLFGAGLLYMNLIGGRS